MDTLDTDHTDTEDFEEVRTTAREVIKEKILHALRIWPYLNPSMLQVGIGTALTPKLWHPVLESLETEGVITRDEIRTKTPSGREQVCTVIRLATTPRHQV